MADHRNKLLAKMLPADFALFAKHLEPLDFKIRYNFEEPGKRVEYAHFFDSGVASLVAKTDHVDIEVGIIGLEGMAGLPIVLGTSHSPNSCYAQIAGSCRRV